MALKSMPEVQGGGMGADALSAHVYLFRLRQIEIKPEFSPPSWRSLRAN